jgi:fructose-bisphosphate aldolase class 1
LDAIRYGERDDVKAKMNEVIDHKVSDGLKELLDERALASEHLADADLAKLRAAMDEARRPASPAALHRAGIQGSIHPPR